MSYHARQRARRHRRALSGWWDPAPTVPPAPAPGSEGEQVGLLRSIEAHQRAFVTHEIRARYLQIAAILAIPLAGAVWRKIFGKKHIPPM